MSANNFTNINEEIDRYVNGELTAEEIDELWVELIQHPEHMEYLNTTANLKQAVKEQKQGVSQKVWTYAAAAVIVLLLAVVGTLRFGDFNNPTEVEPITTIELDYYRSTDAVDPADHDKVIRSALELYNQNRFNEAVSLLEKERNAASDVEWVSRLNIMLGTLHYNEDKFAKAATYFSDVVKYEGEVDMLTLEKAYWYLGNSYLQQNMMSKAEEIVQKAYDLNGAYSRVSRSVLDAIADYREQTKDL